MINCLINQLIFIKYYFLYDVAILLCPCLDLQLCKLLLINNIDAKLQLLYYCMLIFQIKLITFDFLAFYR